MNLSDKLEIKIQEETKKLELLKIAYSEVFATFEQLKENIKDLSSKKDKAVIEENKSLVGKSVKLPFMGNFVGTITKVTRNRDKTFFEVKVTKYKSICRKCSDSFTKFKTRKRISYEKEKSDRCILLDAFPEAGKNFFKKY